MNRKKITCVILCGGRSSRMGEDKGLLKVGEDYLVNYVINSVTGHFGEILIVSDNSEYKIFGYRVIGDKFSFKCPMNGIYSGLSESKTRWNLVLACDAYKVNENFITELVARQNDLYNIVVPINNGHYEPLFALYSRDILPHMLASLQSGNYSLIKLIKDTPHLAWYLDEHFSKDIFMNINSRDDLQFLNKKNQNPIK